MQMYTHFANKTNVLQIILRILFTMNNKGLILNEIKSHYKFKSDADFARFLGIKPQTLSSWHTRNTFDYELIYAKCVGIDANWLLTGSGSMLRNSHMEVPDVLVAETNIDYKDKYLAAMEKIDKLRDDIELLKSENESLKKGEEKEREETRQLLPSI
jgi:hypothetical protein